MFTFLPVEECRALAARKDAALNESKARLAWEVTALIHGREEADRALAAAKAAFGGGAGGAASGDVSQVPSRTLPRSEIAAGLGVLDLFVLAGLASSKSEARRLVQQGGAIVNERKVDDEKSTIDASWLDAEGALMLRAGKKRVFRIVAE
jgi:tyrosyl-tRNA synthetase